MWGSDEYRDAARDAIDRCERHALYAEADRIERREQSESHVTVVRIEVSR